EEHRPLSRADIGALLKYDRSHRPTSRLTPDMVAALLKLFRARKRKPFYDDNNSCLCKDGHWVKSKGEKSIDDWLYDHRFVHVYEKHIPCGKICDFFVPQGNSETEGIYIEFWGKTDAAYVKNRKLKTRLYKDHGFKLVEIEPKDITRIDKILSKAL